MTNQSGWLHLAQVSSWPSPWTGTKAETGVLAAWLAEAGQGLELLPPAGVGDFILSCSHLPLLL